MLVSAGEHSGIYAFIFRLLSDIGLGAMTEWRDIVNIVVDRFRLQLKS